MGSGFYSEAGIRYIAKTLRDNDIKLIKKLAKKYGFKVIKDA